MNKKKYEITVRENGKQIDVIKRFLYARPLGNFCPMFCRYMKKTYYVESDDGDVSDPYRREESYRLHIETNKPCKWNL